MSTYYLCKNGLDRCVISCLCYSIIYGSLHLMTERVLIRWSRIDWLFLKWHFKRMFEMLMVKQISCFFFNKTLLFNITAGKTKQTAVIMQLIENLST